MFSDLLVFYESETSSVTLMDEHKLGVFECRVLRLGSIGSHRRLERLWLKRSVIVYTLYWIILK
jgi:hypothetical protein